LYILIWFPGLLCLQVLTGETEATEGTVWKHPNLRIAYVAQHAFHHIEQHLDKTPNEYIQVSNVEALVWCG
jgi:ATPase subunit of ABC transporter with duplicated ATPase domains